VFHAKYLNYTKVFSEFYYNSISKKKRNQDPDRLALGNNVPLKGVSLLFRDLCKALVVEFITKSDPQVKVLLSSREDIFSDYSESGFEEAFGKSFRIERRTEIEDSQRVLYLMLSRG